MNRCESASTKADKFALYQLSRRDHFLGTRRQEMSTAEQHVAVDPAIAQMQLQNGMVHDGADFDPSFDWVSEIVNFVTCLTEHFTLLREMEKY